MVFLLAVGLLLLVAGGPAVSAGPNVINVPDDYPTIQAAVNAASPGDTILVYPGTYEESITINKQLTLQGVDRGTTIIKGTAHSRLVGLLNILADGVAISGITIHSEIGTHWTIAAEGDNATLTDLYVIHDHPTGAAIHIGKPYIGEIPINGFTFTDSIVDSAKSGVFVPSDKGGSNFMVQSVEFDTSWTAVELKGIKGARVTGCTFTMAKYPFYLSDSNDIEISSNEFVGSASNDIAVFLEAYPTGTTVGDVDIVGNVISGFTTGVFLSDGLVTSGISVNYNNIENNATGISNGAEDTVDAENNWWGTIIENEIATLVSGDIIFDPWLDAPYPEGVPMSEGGDPPQNPPVFIWLIPVFYVLGLLLIPIYWINKKGIDAHSIITIVTCLIIGLAMLPVIISLIEG